MAKSETPDKPKKKTGRPSSFTQETADSLCQHLAEGKSLRSWCEIPGNPKPSVIYDWMFKNAAFHEQYRRAREEQAETWADQIHEIALTEEDTNRARIRIDAIKWAASKLKPKTYGDKITQEHIGHDGGPVQVVNKLDLARWVADKLVAGDKEQEQAKMIDITPDESSKED